MQAFTKHTGTVAILWRGNVDTDQIISKEHLKSIQRTGFGPALFSGWRYDAQGRTNPDFELNRPEFSGASILLAGNNFGCGSSREHAVWAIVQYGFCVVIAPSRVDGPNTIPAFADIFRNNSVKNALLLIELSEPEVLAIKAAVEANPKRSMTVDLASQTITFGDQNYAFQIDASVKDKLLRGLDDIGLTLLHESDIAAYEGRRRDFIVES